LLRVRLGQHLGDLFPGHDAHPSVVNVLSPQGRTRKPVLDIATTTCPPSSLE
jgi:hypothetical protein